MVDISTCYDCKTKLVGRLFHVPGPDNSYVFLCKSCLCKRADGHKKASAERAKNWKNPETGIFTDVTSSPFINSQVKDANFNAAFIVFKVSEGYS